MIKALLKRRAWLWKNRLMPSMIFILILPVILYFIISASFGNIIITSLASIPFNKWFVPGILFIIGSISVFPLLFRDFYLLRVDRKMLTHISMAPYSKKKIIFSYLFLSVFEALTIVAIITTILTIFMDFSYSISEYMMIVFQLSFYLLICGNAIITCSLLIDSITLFASISLYLFSIIIFGSGFIIELGLFPSKMFTILSYQPFSIPFQVLQLFLEKNIIDWNKIIFLFLLFGSWLITNSILLRRKLNQ